jgi:hypothetical protein
MAKNDITEAEAAERWCPMARVTFKDADDRWLAPAHNTFDGGREHANKAWCIGSRCMMCRWADDDHGRCGLAGVGQTMA